MTQKQWINKAALSICFSSVLFTSYLQIKTAFCFLFFYFFQNLLSMEQVLKQVYQFYIQWYTDKYEHFLQLWRLTDKQQWQQVLFFLSQRQHLKDSVIQPFLLTSTLTYRICLPTRGFFPHCNVLSLYSPLNRDSQSFQNFTNYCFAKWTAI